MNHLGAHLAVTAVAVLVLWAAATTNAFDTWVLVGSAPWWEALGILEGMWLVCWLAIAKWGA